MKRIFWSTYQNAIYVVEVSEENYVNTVSRIMENDDVEFFVFDQN